jgi:prevent-host-death family protein
MIAQITANDLKVKGITAIDELVVDSNEVVITVRGKQKYVILPIEEYNQLREFELDVAIREAQKEYSDGNYFTGSIEEHLNRVKNV